MANMFKADKGDKVAHVEISTTYGGGYYGGSHDISIYINGELIKQLSYGSPTNRTDDIIIDQDKNVYIRISYYYYGRTTSIEINTSMTINNIKRYSSKKYKISCEKTTDTNNDTTRESCNIAISNNTPIYLLQYVRSNGYFSRANYYSYIFDIIY